MTGGLLILADIVLPTFEKNAFSSSHLDLEFVLVFWGVLCFELFFSVIMLFLPSF